MENERTKKKTGVKKFYAGNDISIDLMLRGYGNPVLYADSQSANFTYFT